MSNERYCVQLEADYFAPGQSVSTAGGGLQHSVKCLTGTLQRAAVGTESLQGTLAHGGGSGRVRKQMRRLRKQIGFIVHLDGPGGVA